MSHPRIEHYTRDGGDWIMIVPGQFSITAYPLDGAESEWCYVICGVDRTFWSDTPERVRKALIEDAIRRARIERERGKDSTS